MGKLSLWIGLDHNAFIDPGGYFDRHYNPKWLEDDFVKVGGLNGRQRYYSKAN